MRDIFQKELPGLKKHKYIIRLLLKKHLPDVHWHFELHQVPIDMYASQWIISAFTSILPETDTKVTAAFFSLFFKYKWEFFYKLVLTIFQHLQAELLKQDDMFGIIQLIKAAVSTKNDDLSYGKDYVRRMESRKALEIQDSDLESLAGSVQRSKETQPTPEKVEPAADTVTPQPSSGAVKAWFGGIGSLFGLAAAAETPGGEDETPGMIIE